MNKPKNILILLIVLLLTGCEDFLVLEPQNKIIKEDFWNNKEEVEMVVAATYHELRECANAFFVHGELRSGTYEEGPQMPDSWKQMMEGNIYPFHYWASWGDYYDVINMANLVMENMPAVQDRDPSFTDTLLYRFEAELLYLRSQAFFHLVRTFRDVPLTLNSYQDDNQDFYLPKSSQADILAQIRDDLIYAEAYAANPSDYSSIEMKKGRVTNYAINALLADVMLWMENYDGVVTECNKVINSGKFALMGGSIWFDIFYPGNSNEAIFELQFDGVLEQTNQLLKRTSNIQGKSNYYIIAGNKITDFFDENDLRGENNTFITSQLSIWKYIGASNYEEDVYREYNDPNWIFYRLADAYLMRAEANIGLGNFQEALNDINIIRDRAGIEDLNLDTDSQASTDEYYEQLLNERLREFTAEGKRWFDLVRIGSKENFAYDYILENTVLQGMRADIKPLMESKLTNHDFWYMPIAEKEIKQNPNLEQNPYYAN